MSDILWFGAVLEVIYLHLTVILRVVFVQFSVNIDYNKPLIVATPQIEAPRLTLWDLSLYISEPSFKFVNLSI